MTRQQRFNELVAWYWECASALPEPNSMEKFERAQRELANYVAQNAKRVAIASGR